MKHYPLDSTCLYFFSVRRYLMHKMPIGRQSKRMTQTLILIQTNFVVLRTNLKLHQDFSWPNVLHEQLFFHLTKCASECSLQGNCEMKLSK